MQTVSESFDPESVKAGLEALKSGIASAAAMEKALMKEKAEKHSALRKEAQKHAEVEERNLDARIKTLADGYKVELEDALIWKEKRLARIQTAYHSSKSSLARRTQEAKDRRIGKVQGTIMRNRQMRQQDLDAETARHTSFQKQILDDRGVRRELRRRVLSAMRTYRPWIDGWFDGSKKGFPEVEVPATAEKSRAALVETLDEANLAADAAEKLTVTKFFRFIPLWAVTLAVVGMHLWFGMRAGGGGVPKIMPSLLGTLAVLGGLWVLGLFLALPVIRRAANVFAKARTLEVAAEQQSAKLVAALQAEIKEEQTEEKRNLSETFRVSDEEWRARVAEGQRQLDERHSRVPGKLERLYQKKLAALKEQHEEELSRVRNEFDGRARVYEENQNAEKNVIDGRIREAMEKVAAAWSQNVVPHDTALRAMDRASIERFPAWTAAVCDRWEPPHDAPDAVRLGHLVVDEAKLSGGLPSDDLLALPEGSDLTVPFSLGFPHQGSLLIESDGSDDGASARVLNSAVLRILASHPPGRASFVFIDPVGLGKDFAGLMHLADYEETLINHRIWTQNTQIEERLAELNEHIEKVIQMYLRNEYADINAYNQQAGTIAEKYRFVVIAGFPAGFSDTAAKRLMAIASSGARCGVHLLIQRDLRLPAPDPALEDELRRVCRRVVLKGGVYHLTGLPPGADVVEFDPAPAAHDAISLVHKIGKASIDSNRVQVPFSQIAPPAGEEWSLDTSEELRVPVGRTGAKKLQMLAIGKGTRQHMLVAGKTGSGKSTLFHVIITNLARWASPEQVEFYLVDFKKGVEFKCYAAKHLPHARVVAIESDREFALSVLQRVDAELKRRGELFRKAGAQDVAGYKKTPGAGPMPRTLLLIDEFQEFFTEDDAVAQEASLLLDRIVRQGRAFGIHVILGSQTLGGAYTLARATLGQMVIRVALQCNEADAQLIMDDDNPAPRLLTRPGEGIYNDQAGALAANSPFQIVWLPEDERDKVLDEVNSRARASSKEVQVPIVFEGNAPAEIRDNAELAALIRNRPAAKPKKSHAWLGAPNSIKGPTEAVFQRQSGSHLLVVGQSTERSMSQLAVSLAALALQYPAGQAEFVVLDPHASESDADGVFHRLAAVLPNKVRIGGPAEVSELMNSLSEELTRRIPTSGREAPEVFLLVHDLQRFKALRPEDEFKFSMDDEPAAASPSKVFADLLGEGAPCGMHVITSTDTWNNVSRWIPRKLMAEFEMRVLFQMSANDSANLIDSPAATTLGLHRALFYNEHLGTLETFRPYALPDSAWIEDLASGVGVH